MTEDLELRIISGPPRYHAHTDKPIEYLTIALVDGTVAGFLYANDEDGVVGWLSHPAAGHHGHAAYVPWLLKLRACKQRELLPSAALDELAATGVDATDDPASRVLSVRGSAASVEALRLEIERLG
jgi:hypothetical protein